MLILAVDTCDPAGSVALLRDTSVLSQEAHSTDDDYSSWLLPATGRVLSSCGIALKDIELFAAAAGPGSFTGVRVGLTTVKAWSELYGTPIAAASRLQALAEESSGPAEFVGAFFDARRNQIFAALYNRGRELTRVEDEAVIGPAEFLAWCVSQTGNGTIDWVSSRPACLTQTPLWSARSARGETVQLVEVPLAPRIGLIGLRMARENRLTDAFHLDANYIRRSDAEFFWKGAAHGD